MHPSCSGMTRVFGGKPAATATTNPLLNPSDQVVPETVAAGATHRRVVMGPLGDGAHWSYHVRITTAGGATSSVKAFYSNLPDPDPTNADHWGAAEFTIDGAVAATSIATLGSKSPAWIKLEAQAVTSAMSLWGYVRVNGVDE
jgi:hypothetical protein